MYESKGIIESSGRCGSEILLWQTFWLNPTIGEPEPRPIYEVLSSHSARKAFAGNMYKNVKDPNLVCALTGHKEGSKAFKIEWDLGSYAISLNP